LGIVGVLFFAVCLFNSFFLNLEFPWSSVRLAPTFALWQGYPLYSINTEPPWVMVGYGPLYPFMYTPSLVAATPIAAVAIATALSHLFILAPLLLLTHLACGGDRSTWRKVTAVGALIYLLFLSVPALNYVVTRIAADAPAFGFLLTGAWFLVRGSLDNRSSSLRGACIAGMFLGFSVACKINLAPASLAFAVWCFWFCGFRSLVGMATCSAASVACVYGIACINSDPKAILLNFEVLNGFPWILFPLHTKFVTPGEKLYVLAIQLRHIFQTQGLLLLTVILALLPITREAVRRKLPAKAAPALAIFFLLLALVMFVPAGLTISKWGGGVNSWALFSLPLTLAVAFTTLHYSRDVISASDRFLWALFLPWVLFFLVVDMKPWEIKQKFQAIPATDLAVSYRLAQECKGTCYLPFDPLAHLLVDGTFHPNLDVIESYSLGGHPVDKNAFSTALPENLAKIYVPKSVALWGLQELTRLTSFQVSKAPITTTTSAVERESRKLFMMLVPDTGTGDR